jgi:hypothetical protein
MDIEKEIDYRVQLSGRRLGQEDAATRSWYRQQIEMEAERRKHYEQLGPPTIKLPDFTKTVLARRKP